MELRDKVVVVTGGASGIGAATVRRFAAEGAHICILDRDLSAAAALAAELGDGHLALELDVRFEAGVELVAQAVYSHWGQVDVLVNNAGIGYVMKDTRDVSPEEWQLVIDVTLSGVFLCTQAAASHMERAGSGGRIINIASQAAKSGFPHMAPYCAAKHGVIGLTRTAAIDYGSAGITVNAVCPNHVTTGLGSAQNAYFSAFKGMTESAYLEEMAARIPLRRIGLASDTAAVCAFLASDEASFITGEAINVSGGEEMH